MNAVVRVGIERAAVVKHADFALGRAHDAAIALFEVTELGDKELRHFRSWMLSWSRRGIGNPRGL